MLRIGGRLSFEELKAFLMKKEIAKFKLPERLEILDEFPLSTFGKVSKKTLAETISRKASPAQSYI
jgi:2,3-dihydroxybenzoate-AMP ligase